MIILKFLCTIDWNFILSLIVYLPHIGKHIRVVFLCIKLWIVKAYLLFVSKLNETFIFQIIQYRYSILSLIQFSLNVMVYKLAWVWLNLNVLLYGILLTSRWIGFFNIVKYTHLTWVFLHQLQNFTNKNQKKNFKSLFFREKTEWRWIYPENSKGIGP